MPDLSEAQVLAAFEQLTAETGGPPGCTCQNGHDSTGADGRAMKFCPNPAVVQAEIHIVHVCRHPDLVEKKFVNAHGNTTQLLCAPCLEKMRRFADAKIAQTRAKCTELSTTCQTCGQGLALRAPAQPGGLVLLPVCPNCEQDRIQFEPVCGAGVLDKQGKSYGCGWPLRTHMDIIRSVDWLDEMGKK